MALEPPSALSQNQPAGPTHSTGFLEGPQIIASPAQLLKAYVVSDVHLNDHPYDRHVESENPRRKHFREFLTRINHETYSHEAQRTLLVMNGDVLDMTGSWFEPVQPWDSNVSAVEACTLEVLGRILDNNDSVCNELTRHLAHEHGELVFVMGNHDGLLRRFAKARELLTNRLAPDPEMAQRIRFVDSLDYPELGLYAEHGHQFDRFNRSDEKNQHPLGDYVNILIVNRFVELVMSKLGENGFSVHLINELRQRLHDIEYLRPFSLIPLWVENIAKEYRNHPENEGKAERIEDIILWVMAEILDMDATRHLVEQLKLPRKFLTTMVNWYIHLPGTLPIVSFLVAQAMRRTHSNRYQYRMAQRLHEEKGYQLITFGHTHIPQVLPLSENGYFFNTGSWKPVVNLFKEPHLPVADTNLEYLTPNVRFNKIERSGILVIEKNLAEPDQSPRFSLHTNESSHSEALEPRNASVFGL
jgi:UDP-2,3-diacylglucosamine pyrophosphatase LpxH